MNTNTQGGFAVVVVGFRRSGAIVPVVFRFRGGSLMPYAMLM